ncbi:MAG: Flp pilus assembly protein CpaB, partial [Candidatus Omnitrophica bacterium]|nr:Flp pilus assembly protein CpaB [Candidatus Omnitrophota bacterium]
RRQLIYIISAIIMGVVGIFLTQIYLTEKEKVIQKQTQEKLARLREMQATVLVATKDIHRGNTIDETMFEAKVIPKEYVQPQAVNTPARILGMMVIADIVQGEQITLTKLSWPKKQEAASTLSMATPVGKRAITLQVDNLSSFMGMIKPGDYIDVLASLGIPVQGAGGQQMVQNAVIPLFQNVLVLAVGGSVTSSEPQADSRYRKQEAPATGGSIVTLALSPQEASLLAFVQEQAKIRFLLRSPADSQLQPVQPVSWDTLFRFLIPQESQSQDQIETSTQMREIEIYRGLKREVIHVPNK